jgi:hypothetical protein
MEREEIMAYLDGELVGGQAARAAMHLQECRLCQQFAAELRSVSQAMTHWEVELFESEMDGRLLTALQEREGAQTEEADAHPSGWHAFWRVTRWPRWGWVTAAASIAVLLIAGGLLQVNHREPAAIADRSLAMAFKEGRESAPRSPSPQVLARNQALEEEFRRREESQIASSLQVDRNTAGGVSGTVTAYVPPVPGAGPVNRGGPEAPNAPMIVRTAELAITTRDFDAARTRVDDILKREGGYVGEMNISSPGDAERKLTAVLRVPADRLGTAITELKQVGHAESESQAGEEVASQYVDLQARLTNARNTEQRLTELLRTRTGKLEEVVAVEEKLSQVREEIERMEAERKTLTRRVDFATLNLSLSEEHRAQLQVVPRSVGTQFRNAAVQGYRSVVDSIVEVLLFLMSWGPSLLLWGAIVFFPARFLWRRVRTRAAQ